MNYLTDLEWTFSLSVANIRGTLESISKECAMTEASNEYSSYLQQAGIVDGQRDEPETRDLAHDLSRRMTDHEQEQSDIM